MDNDRIAGSAKHTKGSVKEAIGKITGDSKTQAEGAAEKTAGSILEVAKLDVASSSENMCVLLTC